MDSGAHLKQGKTYTYHVVASNTDGDSQASFSKSHSLTAIGTGASQLSIRESVDFDGQPFNLSIKSYSTEAKPFGKHGIDPNRNTWVLVHGWRSDPSKWADAMARTLSRLYPDDTLITVDWSQAADTPIGPAGSLLAQSRIPVVGEWVGNTLKQNGMSTSRMKYIGHCYGTYVSHEAIRVTGETARLMLAFNPGADAKFFPWDEDEGWSRMSSVSFRQRAAYSWSFVDADEFTVSNWGDNWGTAETARHTFLLEGPGYHSAYVMYQRLLDDMLLNRPMNPATVYFQIPRLVSPIKDIPWEDGRFNENGDLVTEGGFEGWIRIENSPDSGVPENVAELRFAAKDASDRNSFKKVLAESEPRVTNVTNVNAPSGAAPLRRAFSPSGSASLLTISDSVLNFSSVSRDVEVVYFASNTTLATSPRFEIGRRRIAGMRSRSESLGEMSFDLYDIPAEAISGGRFYVGAIANPTATSEFDEIFWARVGVPAGFGTPDLVGQDFQLKPYQGTYGWGSSLDASFRVSNIGTGYANPFSTGVYLSPDAIFDGSDILLGSITFDGLQGNSTTGGGFRFSLPATAPAGFSDGTVYVGLWADRTNIVTGELSESNNRSRGLGNDYSRINVSGGLSATGEPTIGDFTINGVKDLTLIRGVYVDLLATNVVDNLLVNEVVYRLDSNLNGILDSSDLYVDHGSKSGTVFTSRSSTQSWPIGTYDVFAVAKDNEDKLSAPAKVRVTVQGNGLAVPDAYELNETLQTAHYLGGAGVYSIQNLSITDGDTDWFSIDIASGNVNLDVTALFFQETTGSGNLFLEVYRQVGGDTPQAVGFSDSSRSGNTQERVVWSGAGMGRYYFHITHQNQFEGVAETNPNFRHSALKPTGFRGSGGLAFWW